MATKTSGGRDFQDNILGRLIGVNRAATIYLRNRMAVRGRILEFDAYVILLEPLDGSPPQMIYKSAVVSISGPPRPMPRRGPGGPPMGGPRRGPMPDRPPREGGFDRPYREGGFDRPYREGGFDRGPEGGQAPPRERPEGEPSFRPPRSNFERS